MIDNGIDYDTDTVLGRLVGVLFDYKLLTVNDVAVILGATEEQVKEMIEGER